MSAQSEGGIRGPNSGARHGGVSAPLLHLVVQPPPHPHM